METKIINKGRFVKGHIMSDEVRLKISLASKGRQVSGTTRKKIGDIHRGRVVSFETRLKQSLSAKGNTRVKGKHWKLSEDARNNISKGKKGIKLSEEHRLKIKKYYTENPPQHNLGNHLSEETKRKIGVANSIALRGRRFSTERREKLKGRTPWNKGTKGLIKVSEETRRKIADAHRGEKSHLWKGGITPKNTAVRNSLEYRLFREAVFKRDNWTCQECKERGGELNAHHIKPFAWFPELRLAIDNGVTLCKACHKKTDSFASKVKTLKQ